MNGINLVTFDIFDTVLIRRCGKPDNVFVLLALYLFPDDVAKQEEFIVWRRSCSGYTLESFYSKANAISFAPYNYRQLIDAELHVEEDLLVANFRVKNIISELRSKGNVIKFLSDMYLPSAFLEFVLRREGCFVDGDEVIVSCEWRARKENGSLYQVVSDAYRPESWIHYGDNKYSDVMMAKRFGIKTVHVKSAYTDIEQNWIDDSFDHLNGWQLSLLAGIARASRLMVDSGSAFRLAIDYIIPIYLPFVVSVMNKARARGIKRIYFLSRDAFVLHRIAGYLPHDDLDIRLLFVSRMSLVQPFVRISGADGYMTCVKNHTLIGRSVDELLANLQISMDVVRKFSDKLDFSVIETLEQEEIFLDVIFNNLQFVDFMRNVTDVKLSVLKEYFAQEGLLDGVPSAVVDIGWFGSLRLMLNGMLKFFGAKPLEFYYLSVTRNALSAVYGDFIPFFKIGNLSVKNVTVIQHYYSLSPWPDTIGYAKDNDTVVPVFEDDKAYEESETVKTIIGAVDVFVPQFAECGFNESILYYWAKNTANCVTECRFKEELSPLTQVFDKNGEALVRKLSPREVLDVLFLGKRVTLLPLISLYYTLGFDNTNRIKKLFTLFCNKSKKRNRKNSDSSNFFCLFNNNVVEQNIFK